MQVVTTHQIDASEPDAQGQYEYYYEFDSYRFSEGRDTLFARSYTDAPEEAYFLSIERGGKSRLLRDADLETPLFVHAADHLRAAGKRTLTWLSGRGNGYEPLP